MKKLLVLLAVAALVLSLATVSMGAATLKGDFRYEMYQDESNTVDESYAVTDFRFQVSGSLSETLDAYAKFKIVNDGLKKATSSSGVASWDEYYVTYKESWGSSKIGFYEHKFTPSRAILKSGHYHVWEKVDMFAATTFNLSENFTADLLIQPYAQKSADDGAYGASVAYNGENWGARITYADLKKGDAEVTAVKADDADVLAFDVYYQINDNMKVFALGVDYGNNDEKYATAAAGTGTSAAKNVYDKNGIDGIDPVIGFAWANMFGTKLSTTWEYAINKRFEDTQYEYNEYAIGAKYQFTNKTGLEIEHTIPGDDMTKTMVKLRYQF